MRAIPLIATLTGVMLLLASCSKPGQQTVTLVGNPTPAIKLSTLDGSSFSPSDESGKVLLLDFWATWCPPCRQSLPHVQELSADADRVAKGLVVQTINDQESSDVIQKFQKDNGYRFPVALDPDGSAADKYHVEGIPTTVLVGRDGKVRNVWVGYDDSIPAQINDAVDKALSESRN